ncbi:MucBP domain-containing protein [Leuconostoc pseudomesenteroides]|uniref:MucBP domain-containing protein n=1 Tax=Leuconostoc pseudomesenteroides TaxID=33968 RepID=UPI0040355DAE
MRKCLVFLGTFLLSIFVVLSTNKVFADISAPTYSADIVPTLGNGIPSYSDNDIVKEGLHNAGINQLTVDDNSHQFSNSSMQASYRVGLNPNYDYSSLTISPESDLAKDYPFIVSHVALVSGNNVSALSFEKNSDGSFSVNLSNISISANSYVIYSLEPAKSSDNGSHGDYHVSLVSDFTVYAKDKVTGQELVNGSSYTDQHPNWGTMWGTFKNQQNIVIANHSLTTNSGIFDLSSLVEGYSGHDNPNFTVIDSEGNNLAKNVTNFDFTKVGKYFVRFSTQLDNGDFLWNSSEIDVTSPLAGGDVTANYVDENGNKITAPVVKSGNVGDEYSTEQKEIDGYTFKKVQGNTTGTFTSDAQTVTYVYTKNPVTPASPEKPVIPDNGKTSSTTNNNTTVNNTTNNNGVKTVKKAAEKMLPKTSAEKVGVSAMFAVVIAAITGGLIFKNRRNKQ